MLRPILAVLLAAGALWQAVLDWQATIGRGYAYRLTAIDAWLEGVSPRTAARVHGMIQTGVPAAVEGMLATLLGLPLALVLGLAAAVLWLTRGRRRGR